MSYLVCIDDTRKQFHSFAIRDDIEWHESYWRQRADAVAVRDGLCWDSVEVVDEADYLTMLAGAK